MPKDAGQTIELDEAAARSHTPPGWPLETIELMPSGKAPKHYGPDVYRFGAVMTLSVILPRRGWTQIKKTKTYIYLTPPEGAKPPFRITIAVPPKEECIAIAERSYARGESWMGQLGEWPAWYLHERNKDMQRMWRDRRTGLINVELLERPPESSLSIGERGVWNAQVTGIGSQFAFGHLPPGFQVPGAEAPVAAPAKRPWEGAPLSVELTTYERSAEARRLCIAHYGSQCAACGLEYKDKYGPIGAELIHVHHVTPLAMIGETYQVDPIRDLIPLCATCHHVVHSRTPPYSVDEVQQAIKGAGLLGNV